MKKYILLIISLINIAVKGVLLLLIQMKSCPHIIMLMGLRMPIHQNGCFYLFRVFLYCFQLYMRFTQR